MLKFENTKLFEEGADAGGGEAAPAESPAPSVAPDAGDSDPGTAPGGLGLPEADHFYDNFKDQGTKDFAINKGFTDAEAVVHGYHNLEKLAGVSAENLLKLPGAEGTPEQWGEVFTKLGRPATADEYGLKTPEGQTHDLASIAGAKMHELGLSSDQANGFTDWWNDLQAANQVQYDKDYSQSVMDDTAALKSEWGSAHDKNMQTAKNVAQSLGFDGKMIDSLEEAMGFGNVMRMMKNIGAKLGEDSFVAGGDNAPTGIVMEPDVAKARIAELRADKGWVKKYLDGDTKSRKEMSDLHKYAFPE